MTQRGNNSHDIRRPDSVALGELALAAGIARRPVTVCFAESDGIVSQELWSYFGQLVGKASVLHIHSRGDINKLTKNFGFWRLLIVHAPQLLNEIAWKVSTHGRENATRPSIFVRGVSDNVEDLPIPVLTLRSNSEETSAIVQWLLAGCPSRGVLLNPPNEIAFDQGLLPVLTPSSLPNGLGPESLGDCKLLAALLAGKRLIRGIDSTVPPTHARQLYEQVRRLLNSPILASQAAPISQLAVEMVRRANVFLRLKSDPAFLQENRTFCTSLNHIHREQRNQTSRELISRREIADLGNLRSRVVLRITGHLQKQPDGLPRFREMGLSCESLAESKFKNANSQVLIKHLRPWSAKQVRMHFASLRKSGYISGERAAANAPWQYRLPEEFSQNQSPFRNLPPATELFGTP